MPKDFTRVNVVRVDVPGYTKPDYYARIEEWRAYLNGARWEGVFTIAHAPTEEEARKKAAAFLREWAAELEVPAKKKKPAKKPRLDMPRGWNRYNVNEGD